MTIFPAKNGFKCVKKWSWKRKSLKSQMKVYEMLKSTRKSEFLEAKFKETVTRDFLRNWALESEPATKTRSLFFLNQRRHAADGRFSPEERFIEHFVYNIRGLLLTLWLHRLLFGYKFNKLLNDSTENPKTSVLDWIIVSIPFGDFFQFCFFTIWILIGCLKQ